MNLPTMMKQPIAFLPVAMSFAALATVLASIASFGVVREPDEGTAAHIWQLLMIAQVPIVALFAIKWLPRAPSRRSARSTCTRFLSQPLGQDGDPETQNRDAV